MNVLSLVSYNFLPAKMGGQKHIALHNNYLHKLVPLICVTTSSNQVEESDYKVYPILNESGLRYINVFNFFKLKRIIQQEAITHIIIEHPYLGWLGVLLKNFCRIKLIVHSHNIEANRFKTLNKWWWKILRHYEKWVHQQADFSLFITEEDKIYAEKFYRISQNKCSVSTYGIEIEKRPSSEERLKAKQAIQTQYSISSNEKIILFNGTLSYTPNLHALDIIINIINPFLVRHSNNPYKILICGKGLPNSFAHQQFPNIIFCGMVDEIATYFKAADIFINPVLDGGGIKTKVVEALANDTTVISTQSGAIGIPLLIINDKLLIINDGDWSKFSQAIINSDNHLHTPDLFYQHFYWGNIAKKTYEILQQI